MPGFHEFAADFVRNPRLQVLQRSCQDTGVSNFPASDIFPGLVLFRDLSCFRVPSGFGPFPGTFRVLSCFRDLSGFTSSQAASRAFREVSPGYFREAFGLGPSRGGSGPQFYQEPSPKLWPCPIRSFLVNIEIPYICEKYGSDSLLQIVPERILKLQGSYIQRNIPDRKKHFLGPSLLSQKHNCQPIKEQTALHSILLLQLLKGRCSFPWRYSHHSVELQARARAIVCSLFPGKGHRAHQLPVISPSTIAKTMAIEGY